MTDEKFFDGVRYVLAVDAAREFGVTNDYITQFCRQGKIAAKQVGKIWYVDPAALAVFFNNRERELAVRKAHLKKRRAQEYQLFATRSSSAYMTGPAAAREFGVTNDYITQFCRQGKIAAKQIGKIWYVERNSAADFFLTHIFEVAERKTDLKYRRLKEYSETSRCVFPADSTSPALEFLHKLVALTLAFMLTFGTFAVVDPSYARYALDSAR